MLISHGKLGMHIAIAAMFSIDKSLITLVAHEIPQDISLAFGL